MTASAGPSGLDDAYRIHHIDTGSIVDPAMTMAGR
jgi:hypothetical protein